MDFCKLFPAKSPSFSDEKLWMFYRGIFFIKWQCRFIFFLILRALSNVYLLTKCMAMNCPRSNNFSTDLSKKSRRERIRLKSSCFSIYSRSYLHFYKDSNFPRGKHLLKIENRNCIKKFHKFGFGINLSFL